MTAYQRIGALEECNWGALADAAPGSRLWPQADALVKRWTSALARTPHNTQTPELRPFQAVCLEVAARQARTPGLGLVAQAGVGKGKTLAAMLLPTVFKAKNPVLMIPPSLLEQTKRDRFDWSLWFHVPAVTIVTYSALSRPDGTDLLRRIQPDLIICDEAHSLKNAAAARSMRFYRALAENPQCRVVAMTATLTDQQLSDFATLFSLALRDTSPVPLVVGNEATELKAWGAVVDTKGKPSTGDFTVMGLSLRPEERAGGHDKTNYRRGMQRLLRQAPGVIMTSTGSVDTPLAFRAVEPDLSDTVQDYIHDLVEEWVLPDGTQVVDAPEFSRAAKQLSLGFYYRWIWPNGPDKEWLEARRAWNAALREFLNEHAREWTDSPFLVEKALQEGRLRAPGLLQVLNTWVEQRSKPKPATEAVWLDYSPVLWAVDWLENTKERGILWYHSRAVGALLTSFGIPTLTHSGCGVPDPTSHAKVALPVTVYGKGVNLQAWRQHLVLEPPTSASAWEQLAGRAHRQGQTLPVTFDVATHTDPFRASWYKALARARFVTDTLGNQQKLLVGSSSGFQAPTTNKWTRDLDAGEEE